MSKSLINDTKETSYTLFDKGKRFQSNNQLDESIVAYIEAIQENRELVVDFYFQLKFANLNSKHLEQVIDFIKKQLQKQPNSNFLYTFLGDLLTKQGRYNDAINCYKIASYRKVTSFCPEFAEKYWDDNNNRKPDFLIIGFAKSGTTSLHQYIEQHPRVLPAIKKEINFWVKQDIDFWQSHDFEKGIEWYLSHFPPIAKEDHFLTGEANPWIFLSSQAPKNILSLFPKVKLLAVLRNPVDRTISHYYHMVKHGQEKRKLEEVVDTEISLLDGIKDFSQINRNYWQSQRLYLATSLYLYGLKKWLTLFEKEKLMILKSEDIYDKPETTMKQVFSFLSLPDNQLNEYRNFLPGSYSSSSTDSDVRRKLSDFFQPYNRELEDYLGISFGWNNS